ncbi:MAG: hypothetical protein NC041_07215 [Bacteroides sp.]|nr:hypothetical protein [Prevotella sp.]MCM1407087.1 hypothetical protein [Treponema brennaborense]MCM1470239.1 hypothetical protein [Bacteroides sp.]
MNKISFNNLCDAFVNIFVVQTFIELLCCMNPDTLGKAVRFFNHYDFDDVRGIGSVVRGFALSAATCIEQRKASVLPKKRRDFLGKNGFYRECSAKPFHSVQ